MIALRFLSTVSALLLTAQLAGQYPVIARLDAALSANEPPFAELTEPEHGELYRLVNRLLRDSLVNRGLARNIYRTAERYAPGNREPARIGLVIELGHYQEADSLLKVFDDEYGQEISGSLLEAALLEYRLETGAMTGRPVPREHLERAEVLLQQRILPAWERAQLSIRMGEYLSATGGKYSGAVYIQNGIEALGNAGGEQLEVFRRALFSFAKLQRELGRTEAAEQNLLRARDLSREARALQTTELESDLEVLRAAAEASARHVASDEDGQSPKQANRLPYYALAALLIVGFVILVVRRTARRVAPTLEERTPETGSTDPPDFLYQSHFSVSEGLWSPASATESTDHKSVIRAGLKQVSNRSDPPVNIRTYLNGLLQQIRTSDAWPGPNVGTDLLIADQEIATKDALLIGLLVSTLLTEISPEAAENPWIRIRFYRRGTGVRLIVSDEGHGLPRAAGAVRAIVDALAKELGGTIEWRRHEKYNATVVSYRR